MSDKQATILAGAMVVIVLAISVTGLGIGYRLDHVAQAIDRQTQKCMMEDK